MIKFILSIGVVIILGIYSIFSYIVCLFISDREVLDNYYSKLIRVVFKIVLFIDGVKTHVYGKEYLRELKDEKAIFVISNHRGYFDILTGYVTLDRKCGIVAKDTLRKVPILGYWMKKIHCLFLDRKNLRSGAMMVVDAIKLIENGISIWLFPEGTRNKNHAPEDLLPFKAGAFKIPEKTNCYILPMAIINSENVFEKHLPRITSGDVYIGFGKPYKIENLSNTEKQKIDEYSQNIIRELILDLKQKER